MLLQDVLHERTSRNNDFLIVRPPAGSSIASFDVIEIRPLLEFWSIVEVDEVPVQIRVTVRSSLAEPHTTGQVLSILFDSLNVASENTVVCPSVEQVSEV